MLVAGLNKILNICRVISSGKNYTCPLKDVNGEIFFFFKRKWHKVADFLCENAEELVEEGGKIFSRRIK